MVEQRFVGSFIQLVYKYLDKTREEWAKKWSLRKSISLT